MTLKRLNYGVIALGARSLVGYDGTLFFLEKEKCFIPKEKQY